MCEHVVEVWGHWYVFENGWRNPQKGLEKGQK